MDVGTLGIKCYYYPYPSVPCHPSVPHLYGQYMNLSSVPLGFISPLVANTHPTGKYFLANRSSSNWPCDPNSANGRALFHQKKYGKGASLLIFNNPTISKRHRDIGNSGISFQPSCVHINERDSKSDRCRDKDNLWTEMWPYPVHIIYMNPKQNRYIERGYLRVARNTRVRVIIAFAP